jgi:hypothetical protein
VNRRTGGGDARYTNARRYGDMYIKTRLTRRTHER